MTSNRFGSSKISAAVSKSTPCFATFRVISGHSAAPHFIDIVSRAGKVMALVGKSIAAPDRPRNAGIDCGPMFLFWRARRAFQIDFAALSRMEFYTTLTAPADRRRNTRYRKPGQRCFVQYFSLSRNVSGTSIDPDSPDRSAFQRYGAPTLPSS